MTTVVETTSVFGARRLESVRPARRLTRVQIAGLAAGVVLVSMLLFAVTPLQGIADFLVFAVLFYSVAQTAVSFGVEGRRQAADRLMRLGVGLALVMAIIPLVSVLGYTIYRGAKSISMAFLTHSMYQVGPLDTGGGMYHAIVGTIEQVLIAVVIAVPIGLLTAIYLAEYGRGRFATAVRFTVDLMTGVPSIVAGLFIYAAFVLALGMGYSGFAAALALTILMLPVVIRSSEEMLKLVPESLREASYALGVPRWRTIVSVVLPTASTGITTGVMLAIARVTGETAPILLTASSLDRINTSPFHGAQANVGTFIFFQATSAGDAFINRAWAAALVLIVFVAVLYIAARLLTRRNRLVG
jgi:phosphate transport system permease protein